jgi:hypothetical protein
MTIKANERSLDVVRRHRPDRVPRELRGRVELRAMALVFSTYRSDNPDWFIDYELWFVCMREVSTLVGASSVEVLEEPRHAFARRRSQSLDDFMARARTEPDDPDWGAVVWSTDGTVVAAAMRERYFSVGGPMPYHDSDTTCLFLHAEAIESMISALKEAVPRAGGIIGNVFDNAEADPRGGGKPWKWWPF